MQILLDSISPAYHRPKQSFSKNECFVLIGMAGVGKSTIGKSLSETLSFGFIDLDDYIVDTTGLGLQEIIDCFGDDFLLRLEGDCAYEIALKHNVVAPGGSIIYNHKAMEYLRKHSTIIYLEDSFKNIEKNINNISSRGIIGLKNKTLKEIYNERKPLYQKHADITINCKNKKTAEIIKEINKKKREN